MRIFISFIIFASLSSVFPACSVTRKGAYFAHRGEPKNLDEYKSELAQYYKEEYVKQVEDLLNFARKKISTSLERGEKVVVLFDFADVLFSSWPYQKMFQFGFKYETWKEWVDQADAPSVPGVVEFYRWSRQEGADVKIVSGRKREKSRESDEPSVINLARIGVSEYDIIWIRQEEASDRGAFKRRVREELRRQGYDLIVNIGSQERDFSEESATLHIKLPNPFYRAPSRIDF